jgi:hypothetical protein
MKVIPLTDHHPSIRKAASNFQMFPPVDEAVLRDNPDFAKLHTHLTTVALNPDGSSKNDPGAKERSNVQDVCL